MGEKKRTLPDFFRQQYSSELVSETAAHHPN